MNADRFIGQRSRVVARAALTFKRAYFRISHAQVSTSSVVRRLVPETERRRSSRETKRVDYRGMDVEQNDQSDRTVKSMKTKTASSRARRAVFAVGGRVYDSENGTTCHWCRQKTVETHVTCVGAGCSNGRLPLAFCGMCLSNRHGEDIDDAVASGCWECPRCRGSCGDGCATCCNCGPCRKKAGLTPTHQMIQLARANGFDNVHDYLIHRETGESAETIARRKLGFKWGKWLRDDFCRPVVGAESREHVVSLSSADEESARDVSSSDILSSSDVEALRMDSESESDDEEFMIVQRTPKKRRESPRSTPAVATPSPRGASSLAISPPSKSLSRAKKVSQSADDPVEIGGDIYEFEAILARRRRAGREQCLIKWRGFDRAHATWEPAENIIRNK